MTEDAAPPPPHVSDLANFLTTIYGGCALDEARRRALRRQDTKYRDVAEIWLAVCEELLSRKKPPVSPTHSDK